MKILLIFLVACGAVKPLDTNFLVSSSATKLEVSIIDETLQEFSERTGIQVSYTLSNERIAVWSSSSQTSAISIEDECSEANKCLQERDDGLLSGVLGYAIDPIDTPERKIFLLSLKSSQAYCESESAELLTIDYFKWTLMHELGHAFGVTHTGTGSANRIMLPKHNCSMRVDYETMSAFYASVKKANGLY